MTKYNYQNLNCKSKRLPIYVYIGICSAVLNVFQNIGLSRHNFNVR